MNLLQLTPDIQEEILFLPVTERGQDLVTERELRPIASDPYWQTQRSAWKRFCMSCSLKTNSSLPDILARPILVRFEHPCNRHAGGPDVSKLSEYLTITDAAEYLGVSPNTLRNWGRDGKIPMHRNPINGYRLFKQSDLDRVLKEIGKPVEKNKKNKPR